MKYSRSKVIRECLSQNMAVEQIISKCLELGDKNESCLIYSVKRMKREFSKTEQTTVQQ